jgi:hypothetical protein
MSTRMALVVSLLSIMMTLWVGTRPREPKIYMAGTEVTIKDARLGIDQHSDVVRGGSNPEHGTRKRTHKHKSER